MQKQLTKINTEQKLFKVIKIKTKQKNKTKQY